MGGSRGISEDSVIDHDLRKENILLIQIKLITLRFYEFFKPFPGLHSDISIYFKILAGIFNIPLLVLGFFGFCYACFRQSLKDSIIYLAPIIILTFIHCVSDAPHSRYSLPLVPLLLILGSNFIKNKYVRD